VTTKGRAALRAWLARPVEHVRDVRSLLLLKIVLSQRAGLDVEPLLVAQRADLVPFVTWLEAQLDDVDPVGNPGETTTLYFRLETAKTIVRFIDGTLDDPVKRGVPKRAKRSRQRSLGSAAPLVLEAAAPQFVGCVRLAACYGNARGDAEHREGDRTGDEPPAAHVAVLDDARPGVHE